MPSTCSKSNFKLSWTLPSKMFSVRSGSTLPETTVYAYPKSSSDIGRHTLTATISDKSGSRYIIRLYVTVDAMCQFKKW
jgi:hypothetical protein